MNFLQKITFLTGLLAAGLGLSACVTEPTSLSDEEPVPVAPRANYTDDQLSLRFLSCYIRGDRTEAAQYATPAAIAQLPWKRANPTYIPHFDDRKIFWFDGGLAHVTFSEIDGRNMITNFKVSYRS